MYLRPSDYLTAPRFRSAKKDAVKTHVRRRHQTALDVQLLHYRLDTALGSSSDGMDTSPY